MSDPTVAVYEARAAEWDKYRLRRSDGTPEALAARALPGPVLDGGCGPGVYTAALGPNAIALDGARAMLALVPDYAPGAPRVQADLRRLPFRRGVFGAAWASRSYVHLPRSAVPAALADLHRSLAVDAPVELFLFGGDLEHGPYPGDDFPGRSFSHWPTPLLADVLTGAGFEVDELIERANERGEIGLIVRARRARTLADTVGPQMRLLMVGLNPSVYSADAGAGFARPGNRFWPAALSAGLATRDRDPEHALRHHGMGMTDLVKRASPRADELTVDEYRSGVARLDRLAAWLRPRLIVLVGLAGWRAAVDRAAVVGPQERLLGGRPVYVMPSTSGANAHATPAVLADHLRAAAVLADRSSP